VKKRKKKKISTWEKFKDSSSRISTFPNYFAFEANQTTPKGGREIMEMFDWLTSSYIYNRFNTHFIDVNTAKIANDRIMYITFTSNQSYGSIKKELKKFQESFGVTLKMIDLGVIIKEPDSEKSIEETVSRSILKIPENYTKKQSQSAFTEAYRVVLDMVDFGKDYLNDFFKWWTQQTLFTGGEGKMVRDYSFEAALVEWMRQADPKLAKKAYVSLIEKANDPDIKRIATYLGNKEVIYHVEKGAEVFDMPIRKEMEEIKSKISKAMPFMKRLGG
jgi:hypothetical protein